MKMKDNSIYFAGFAVIATFAIIVLTCIFHLELSGEADYAVNLNNSTEYAQAHQQINNDGCHLSKGLLS